MDLLKVMQLNREAEKTANHQREKQSLLYKLTEREQQLQRLQAKYQVKFKKKIIKLSYTVVISSKINIP